MRPTNCIFCGVFLGTPGSQQSDSRTREHIFARWYRDNVRHNKIKLFTSDGTTDTLHRQPALESFVNSAVCARCNSGWMSSLETQVEPIFEKLKNDEDAQLSPQEVEALARWTGKTAIVTGYVILERMIVPEFIRRTFLPESPTRPHMNLFYSCHQSGSYSGGRLRMPELRGRDANHWK